MSNEKDLPFEQKVQYYEYIIKQNNRNNLLFPFIAIAAIVLITVVIDYCLPDVQAPELIKQIFVFTMAVLGLKLFYGIYRFVKLKTDLLLVKMQERDKKQQQPKPPNFA